MDAFWQGFFGAVEIIVPCFAGSMAGTFWALTLERRKHQRFVREVRAMTEGTSFVPSEYVQQHEQQRKEWL